jgi:hypothetical protein
MARMARMGTAMMMSRTTIPPRAKPPPLLELELPAEVPVPTVVPARSTIALTPAPQSPLLKELFPALSIADHDEEGIRDPVPKRTSVKRWVGSIPTTISFASFT